MTRYDYTYYTALINNNDSKYTIGEKSEPTCTFNETRDVPIITDCKDYEMSITNFKLDTMTLPVFIPVIKYNNGVTTNEERHTTIYSVTLEYNGYSYTQDVIFQPQDETISGTTAPEFKNGYASYAGGYYNIYNYDNFLAEVNQAISDCFDNLLLVLAHYSESTYVGYFDLGGGVYEIPNFIIDKSSDIIYLNAPKQSFNDDPTSPAFISIYLNEPLYRLFNSFPYKKQVTTTNTYNSVTLVESSSNLTTLFKLTINDFKNTNELSLYAHLAGTLTPVSSDKTAHLIVSQHYETLSAWTPIESISIGSSTLPIKSSIISNNHSFVNGRETVEGSSTDTIEIELSEFRVGNFKPGLIYEPKQYRWLNLVDQQSLLRMNIQVYWRFKYTGELIPLLLNSGGSFSLKFCFRKIMD